MNRAQLRKSQIQAQSLSNQMNLAQQLTKKIVAQAHLTLTSQKKIRVQNR